MNIGIPAFKERINRLWLFLVKYHLTNKKSVFKINIMLKKAFTLIELLIVIAILGIRAVGLLIALDPIEQTRRATDATVLRSASDTKNAIDRYYTGKLYYPWCTAASPAGGCTLDVAICATAATAYLLNTGCGTGVLSALVNTGELKATLPLPMTGV